VQKDEKASTPSAALGRVFSSSVSGSTRTTASRLSRARERVTLLSGSCGQAGIMSPWASPSEAELQDWTRDRLAGYKRPRSFSFVREDEVPRNATGKVLYRVLKAQLAKAEAGEGLRVRA